MEEYLKNSRVLIVDDTLKNIQVLGTILKDEGIQVNAATSAQKAFEMIDKFPPDLILLDVMMPEMNGFEACTILKESDKTKDIPVIFLTARNSPDDVVNGFEAGAIDYVTKPFNSDEMLSRVRTQLKLKQAEKEKLDLLESVKVANKELQEQKNKIQDIADKLGKYLSPQIYETIFEGKNDARIGASRKKLSVLFVDLVDFTPATELMKLEDLSVWLNTYLDQMAELALNHGGTIDKFIGDGIMVFFGDPETNGDKEDAIRCVLLGLEMLKRADDLGLNIRIGIHSGEGVVGNFGSKNRMDYTVVGSTVNLASRLESNSSAGRILISKCTQELVKEQFHCELRGEIKVKGIDRDILTYWVKAQK